MTGMAKVAALAERAVTTLDPLRLRELATNTSQSVRMAVAENAHTDDQTVELLMHDADAVVRIASAGNLADRPRLQRIAVESPDKRVRARLAATFAYQDDRSLPYEVQAALASDDFVETRTWIAATTNYLDLFDLLLRDDDPRVRGACAMNPRTSRAQMETLVTDRFARVRACATATGLTFPDAEQLLRLAQDRSAGVRWAVLFRVDRPRAAMQMIAEDSDEMNRRHAEMALLDNHSIMTPDVEKTVRAERERAAELCGVWESPPVS